MHDHPQQPVRTEELVAYAEGRLPVGSGLRTRVEEHLRRHPADAARVQAYRRQDELIREAFDDVAGQPIPERLAPGGAGDHRKRPWGALGMAATLVVGIALGWLGARVMPTGAPQPAMQGFAERVAERLTNATDTATAEGMGTAEAGGVPDLAAAGLRPVGRGGAGDMGARRFDYRDADGNTIHLFVSRDIAAATPSVRTLEAGTLAYWHDGGVTYVLGGQVSGNRLVAMARQVREALGSGTRPVIANSPAAPESAEDVIAVTPDPGGKGGNDPAGMEQGGGAVVVPDQM